MKRILLFLLTLILSLTLIGCAVEKPIDIIEQMPIEVAENIEDGIIDKDSFYTNAEDVSLYIYTYGELPKNFITKKEAIKLGWESNKGNLWDVTDKMSIGGDSFGNREGRLPKTEGRKYYECDINYEGGFRGAERIVFSNDGLIYYTEDHYDTFILLYGDEQDENS